MIILFDAKPADLEQLPDEVLGAAVAALVKAYRCGDNLVVVPYQTGRHLLSKRIFSSLERSTLLRITQQYAQTGDLPTRAHFAMRLVVENRDHVTRKGTIIEVSVWHKSLEAITARPIVVVEDISSDAEVYKFFFDALCRRAISSPIAVEFAHGGGSALERVVSEKISECRIVISVADSDRQSPYSPETKLSRFATLKAQSNWALFFPHVTPCRELENILPLDAAAGLHSVRSSECLPLLIEIERRETAMSKLPSERYYLWFDLKEGLSPAKIANADCGATREWICAHIHELGLDSSAFAVAGLGSNIALTVIRSQDCRKLLYEELRKHSWKETFISFFQEILWLLASSQAHRV